MVADTVSPDLRSRNMRAIRAKDTVPEMIVRRLVFSMGYRYRLHGSSLPGKPDLVFKGRKKVIFVHGCFWHMHGCKRGRMPKSKLEYWESKLMRNKVRDTENQKCLAACGWDVLVIWECEIHYVDLLERKIRNFLDV